MADTFRDLFLGTFPPKARCEVATIERGLSTREQCPEEATFVITAEDRNYKVCGRCMGTQVANLVYRPGSIVSVERLIQ